MQHPFLSDEWLAEVQKLAAEAGTAGMPSGVQINLVVTAGPSGDTELHVDHGSFGPGLVEGCPTKLTLPYAVARKMFIEGDQTAAMQAFMSGQIKVEGDMSKLMGLRAQGVGGAGDPAIQDRLREITTLDE